LYNSLSEEFFEEIKFKGKEVRLIGGSPRRIHIV